MKDLTGQKFGLLTVIERGEDYINPKNGTRLKRWLCRCDCGNTTLVATNSLTSGNTKSCGCYRKRGNHRKDIAGQQFGRLTAVEPSEKDDTRDELTWKCLCDCGNTVYVPAKYLLSGNTKSCGCLKMDGLLERNTKHGKARRRKATRLYKVWIGMRQRCNDPNQKSYPDYGGRGIRVCQEWDNFEAFESWAMSNGYDPNSVNRECTIDRIDVNGNYEPSNCRWVSAAVQNKNKRK